jgi:hypothetical protein
MSAQIRRIHAHWLVNDIQIGRLSKMKNRSRPTEAGILDHALLESKLEAAMMKRETHADGALWRARNDDFPLLRQVAQSCRNFDPDDDPDDFELLDVFAESKIDAKELWQCGTSAGGIWTLHELRLKRRGYLVFTLYGDERYNDGAVLIRWEPRSNRAMFRHALAEATCEWGRALQFPFMFRHEGIDIEEIANERLFREVAREAQSPSRRVRPPRRTR